MSNSAIAWLMILGAVGQAEDAPPRERPQPQVAMILEDNGDVLLPLLTNPTGCPGEGHVDKEHVFSGKSSVRIVPMQRFSPGIPEWKYRIVEKPKPGEYRYLRFAWKAPGCSGIMLQLHDLTDWNIRQTAGLDKYGWGTQYVAPKPPEDWTVVTIDLFKDFGERTIRGLALTCFDGDAGYFDHIYFGRTLDDLDRIDATGLTEGPPVKLTADQLESHWRDVTTGSDAAASYRSFWTLAASPFSVPFLTANLRQSQAAEGTAALKKWIAELDHDDFKTREDATANLTKNLHRARALLEKELKKSESAEVRMRIARLLKLEAADASPSRLAEKAIRILELNASPDALKVLTEYSQGDPDDQITALAIAALSRQEGQKRP